MPDSAEAREAVVGDILAAIEGPGAAFVERHRTAAGVRRFLEEEALADDRAVRLPALLLAQGLPEEATEHVREAVNALDARDDPAAEAYRRFAERVERWVAP